MLGQCDDTEEIDALQSQVTEIAAGVDSLVSDPASIAALSARVSALESGAAATASQIASLNGHVAAADSDISALQATTTTLSGDIATINGQITAIDARISALEAAASRVLFRDASFIFVSNTTALTPIFTYTIPQATAQAGDIYRISVVGIYSNGSGANVDANLRLTLAGIDVWSSTVTVPSSATVARPLVVDIYFVVRPGAQVSENFFGTVFLGGLDPETTVGDGAFGISLATGPLASQTALVNPATQDMLIQVQFQNSVADVLVDLNRHAAWIERLGVAA